MNIDTRVAKCLGWKWYEDSKEHGWKKPNGKWVCDDDSTPKFSSCPTACEEVKAEIRRRCFDNDWYVEFSIAHQNVNDGQSTAWRVEIHTPEGEFARYSDSEYEAVCLAFVEACGNH